MRPRTLPTDQHDEDAAGFWPRAIAWMIDASVLSLPVVAMVLLQDGGRIDALATQWRGLGTLMGELMMTSTERGESPLVMLQSWLSANGALRTGISAFAMNFYAALWPSLALFVILGLFYWPLQEAGRRHAKLGKRALGLSAVPADGGQLDLLQALTRHIAGSLSWLTLNIGHMLAANRPRHQALHDRIAKTQVLWRQDAPRHVPVWGWLLLAVAGLLPLILAVKAASSLASGMQAALGI